MSVKKLVCRFTKSRRHKSKNYTYVAQFYLTALLMSIRTTVQGVMQCPASTILPQIIGL